MVYTPIYHLFISIYGDLRDDFHSSTFNSDSVRLQFREETRDFWRKALRMDDLHRAAFPHLALELEI